VERLAWTDQGGVLGEVTRRRWTRDCSGHRRRSRAVRDRCAESAAGEPASAKLALDSSQRVTSCLRAAAYRDQRVGARMARPT